MKFNIALIICLNIFLLSCNREVIKKTSEPRKIDSLKDQKNLSLSVDKKNYNLLTNTEALELHNNKAKEGDFYKESIRVINNCLRKKQSQYKLVQQKSNQLIYLKSERWINISGNIFCKGFLKQKKGWEFDYFITDLKDRLKSKISESKIYRNKNNPDQILFATKNKSINWDKKISSSILSRELLQYLESEDKVKIYYKKLLNLKLPKIESIGTQEIFYLHSFHNFEYKFDRFLEQSSAPKVDLTKKGKINKKISQVLEISVKGEFVIKERSILKFLKSTTENLIYSKKIINRSIYSLKREKTKLKCTKICLNELAELNKKELRLSSSQNNWKDKGQWKEFKSSDFNDPYFIHHDQNNEMRFFSIYNLKSSAFFPAISISSFFVDNKEKTIRVINKIK